MVIWSLIFLLIIAIAATIIVTYAFYVGKGENNKFDSKGNLTTPGVITAANLSPNNKEEILALQNKTRLIEVVGDTTTFNGNLQVKGETISSNSVVNVYDGYLQINQNPADGNTPSLTITQTGTNSGPIMLVTDGDSEKIFEIGQNAEIYSSGNMTLEGDLQIGTGFRTVTFGVDAATGNTIIAGNLQVTGDISGNNFSGNFFTDIGGITPDTPTTTLSLIEGNGIGIVSDNTNKSITLSLDSAVTNSISSLQTEVEGIQTDVGTLTTTVTGIQGEVDIVQEEVVAVQEEVVAVQTEIEGIQTDVSSLQNKTQHITSGSEATNFEHNITCSGTILATGDITSSNNISSNNVIVDDSITVNNNVTITNSGSSFDKTVVIGDLGLDVIVIDFPVGRDLPVYEGQTRTASTLAELQTALAASANGDTISIIADITLSSTLVVNSGIKLTSDNGVRKISLNLLNAATIQWNADQGIIQNLSIESLGQGSTEVGLALNNNNGEFYVESVYFNVDEFGISVRSNQFQIRGCTFNYARLPANESMRYINVLSTGPESVNFISYNTFNGVSGTSSIQCISTANAAAGAYNSATFVIDNNNSNGTVQRLFMLDGNDMSSDQCTWFLKDNNMSCSSGFYIWYSPNALISQRGFYLEGNSETLSGGATGSKGLIGLDSPGLISSIDYNCQIRSRNNTIPALRSDYGNLTLPEVGVVAYNNTKITPTQLFDSTYYDDVNVDGKLTVTGPASFSKPVTTTTLSSSSISIGSTSVTSGSVFDAGGDTSSIILPKGTTAEQPTPVDGMIRYNTTNSQFEGVSNSTWSPIGGGGGGGVSWNQTTSDFGSPENYLPYPSYYFISEAGSSFLYQDSENDYVSFVRISSGGTFAPLIYNTVGGAVTTVVTIPDVSVDSMRLSTSGSMVMMITSTGSQTKLDEYSYNGIALNLVRNVITITGSFRSYGLKLVETVGSNKILSFGTYNTSTNEGKVYLFNYDGSNWTQSVNSPLTIANTRFEANDTFIIWNTSLNLYQLAFYNAISTGSSLNFWNLTNTGGIASIPSTSTVQTISYPSAAYLNSQASYDISDTSRPYFHISLGNYQVGGVNNIGGFVSSYRWDGVSWSLATDWQVFSYVARPNVFNSLIGYNYYVTNSSANSDNSPIRTYSNYLLISGRICNIYQFSVTKTDVAPYFSVGYVNTLRTYGGSLGNTLNMSYGISPNGEYIFNKAPLDNLPFINVFRKGDGSPIVEEYYQTPDILRSNKIIGVENGGYLQLGVTPISLVDSSTLRDGTIVFDGNNIYIFIMGGWRRLAVN